MVCSCSPSRGPHQRTRCFGSAHTSNASVRGTSYTRSMTSSSASSPIGSAFAAMFLLLSMSVQFLQVIAHPVEAAFPDPPVLLDPVSGLFEWCRLQPPRPPLRLSCRHDQSGPFERLQGFENAGKRHLERLGELQHGRGSFGEAREDRPSCRIRECGERGAQMVDGHVVFSQMGIYPRG